MSLPAAPSVLEGEALAEWNRVCGELSSLGLLTGIDMAALAGYCQAYSVWFDAVGKVKALGILIRTSNGNVIQNPAVGTMNRQYEIILKACAVLGMDPSSRSRLRVEPANVKASKWAL